MRHAAFGVILICLASATSEARGGISSEERQKIESADAALRKAASLYRGKKYKQAAQQAGQAQKLLAELSAGKPPDELAGVLALFEKKVAAAERLLRAKGLDLTGAEVPPTSGAGARASFLQDVLPILAGKCGNCHIRNARGGLSMATFANFKKGSESGIVFTPGRSQGSRLVEVLETGDMPRGGGTVLPEELATIARWIDEGARFDGPDDSTPLATLAPRNDRSDQPMVEVVTASGDEAVQFVRDLGPVLVANCIDCHGGRQPAARLDMTTFSTFLRGGDSGPIVAPGKPQESLLVRKLRGTAGGARMPLRRPPLDEEVIGRFETWIADGAKLDWPDPTQPIELAVRIMAATRMTHEELSASRAEVAERNWRLASPDAAPEKLEGETFLLVGNLTPARMSELAELAKAQQAKVAALLKAPKDRTFLKGRLTLFAFERRFDYSEFGMMVEKRELPADWQAHWRYTVIDAYGCLVVPDDEDGPSLPLELARLFAGAYLESQAEAPRWFTAGAASVIAARADPRAPQVRRWEQAFKEAVAARRSPDLFLKGGEVLTAEAHALAYGFMKSLMAKPARFLALLDKLRGGDPFDSAFRDLFGQDPATLAAAWARQ